MLVESISRTEAACFSNQQIQLAENQTDLSTFLNRPFSLANFQEQILEKKAQYTSRHREVLSRGLKVQYEVVKPHEKVAQALHQLSLENTFTVTTGHQLSLLTGPLYFIYKILHVIKQCEELKVTYPSNNFIPVFWMASEDHDFEEIKATAVFNQALSWEAKEFGAVGRFSTVGLQEIIGELKNMFSNHPNASVFSMLEAYQGPTYGVAFFRFIHELFADFGLVILDGDNAIFKEAFAPIIEKELEEQFSFQAVQETSMELNKRGLKTQVNPREINLFYLSPNKRERIIKNDDHTFSVGSISFSKGDLLNRLKENPQDFSPNVILRPVYQEFILPNVCYVGGVGELNYWLQLKGVFEKAKVVFPLIQVRSSMFYLDSALVDKIDGLGLLWKDFFKEKNQLVKEFVNKNGEAAFDFSLLALKFNDLKSMISNISAEHDTQLSSAIGADVAKMESLLETIKNKKWRAEKQKHEKAIKQIEQIKERLFPKGSMQERSMNFFQICPDGNVSEKLQVIYEAIDPFNSNIQLIIERK